jgi:hypothetical protein
VRRRLLFVSVLCGLVPLVPFAHGVSAVVKATSINQTGKLRVR